MNDSLPISPVFPAYPVLPVLPPSSEDLSSVSLPVASNGNSSPESLSSSSSSTSSSIYDSSSSDTSTVETFLPGQTVQRKRHSVPKGLNGICAVCGDKSSGTHFGARACEGCKSFFRRSAPVSASYRCHAKDKSCGQKKQLKRCRYCRFQRCLTAGMRKDAIRVPKQKQSKPQEEDESPILSIFPQVPQEMAHLVDQILWAHSTTIKIQPNHRPEGMDEKKLIAFVDFSELSSTALFKVTEFVQMLPEYNSLTPSDQQVLLKNSCLEIMLVRMTCNHYDQQLDRFVLSGGLYLTRLRCHDIGLGVLEVKLFEFAKTLARMRLDSTCQGILCAMCFFQSDYSNVWDEVRIQSIQEPLVDLLRILVARLQPSCTTSFSELMTQTLVELRIIARHCREMIRRGEQAAADALKELFCPTFHPSTYPSTFSCPTYFPYPTHVPTFVQPQTHQDADIDSSPPYNETMQTWPNPAAVYSNPVEDPSMQFFSL